MAEVSGIENIYYNVRTGEFDDQFHDLAVNEYFGDCEVFTDENEAHQYAHRLAEGISILEYGICALHHEDQEFRKMTEEEMEFAEAEEDRIMEEAHRKREEETEAKINEALVSMEGRKFEIASLSGYITLEDGTKVHGSIYEGKENIRFFLVGSEPVTFLPSDWNKE